LTTAARQPAAHPDALLQFTKKLDFASVLRDGWSMELQPGRELNVAKENGSAYNSRALTTL
jgi:hypothetical protein